MDEVCGWEGVPATTIPTWELRELAQSPWVIASMTQAAVEKVLPCLTFSVELGVVDTAFQEVADLNPGVVLFQELAVCIEVEVGVAFASFAFDIEFGDCCGAKEVVDV